MIRICPQNIRLSLLRQIRNCIKNVMPNTAKICAEKRKRKNTRANLYPWTSCGAMTRTQITTRDIRITGGKKNIDTAYMSNEVLLAVSGAQAEEESISISKNMIWSINRRMKNGTYLASHTPYGYRIENGEYVIVDNEAEIVKQIFKSYLSGVAKKTIADMLNSMNVPNREGTPWQRSTVEYILGNERYTGNAVFQKTYTDAAEPFKNKPNNGKVPKYYVEDTNPPIISKEEYEAAVRLTEERRNRKPYEKTADRTLNGKIRCSCGGTFGRKTVSGKAYWSCNIHESDSGKCNSRRVPEDDIYEAYITAVNKLREYRCEILLPAKL